jgi:hypothetical protein
MQSFIEKEDINFLVWELFDFTLYTLDIKEWIPYSFA